MSPPASRSDAVAHDRSARRSLGDWSPTSAIILTVRSGYATRLASWRLTHDLDGQWPHDVRYVREALRLVPNSAPAIPPPLSAAIPDRSGLLDPNERDQAAEDWAAWWTRTLDSEQRIQCWSRQPDQPMTFHKTVEEASRAVAPSTAPALASTALQPVAQELFDEADRWINDVRLADRAPGPTHAAGSTPS